MEECVCTPAFMPPTDMNLPTASECQGRVDVARHV